MSWWDGGVFIDFMETLRGAVSRLITARSFSGVVAVTKIASRKRVSTDRRKAIGH